MTDIDFNFPIKQPDVYFLHDGIYEECPACKGRANLCLRCLDEGVIPHSHD